MSGQAATSQTAHASPPHTSRLNPTRLLIIAAVISIVSSAVLFAVHRDNLAWCSAAGILGFASVAVSVRDASGWRNNLRTLLIVWFTSTPALSYFVRYPINRSLLTFDRLVVFVGALLVLSAVLRLRNAPSVNAEADVPASALAVKAQPFRLTGFEIVWIVFVLFAAFSALTKSLAAVTAAKTVVDAFVLPLLFFYAASRLNFGFQGRCGKALLICSIILAFFFAATGGYEALTAVNLFPYQGSEILRDRELRVNGPFAADSSYSIISALIFVFLLAIPRIFEIKFDRGGRVLYWLALAAAGVASLLSAFRAIALAIAVACLLFEGAFRLSNRRNQSTNAGDRPLLTRKTLGAVGGIVLATVVLMASLVIVAPQNVRDRLLSLRNAYGRLASWRVALNIFEQHPILGAGLGNYDHAFHQNYHWHLLPIEVELHTRVATQPHSNIVWIGCELGGIGLLLYVVANFLLLRMGYHGLFKSGSRKSRAAAACFLALLVIYWLPGLVLTSGAYSDLNLYFFFLLGMLYSAFKEVRENSNTGF